MLYSLPTPTHFRGMQIARLLRNVLVEARLGDTPQCNDLTALMGDAPDLGLLYAHVLASMELLVALREAHALQLENLERRVKRGTIPRALLQHTLDDPLQPRIRAALDAAHAWALTVPTEAIYEEDP